MKLNIKSTIALNNGVKMPLLGIGVYNIPAGDNTRNVVRTALEYGYRLIDTARIYGNEKSVGQAINDSAVPRDEIFVTTKLWKTGFENPKKALIESLIALGLDYVDLFLINWPFNGYEKAYLELEKLQKEGLCRSIGVSNFKIHHLEKLKEAGASVIPQVNQTEIHPMNTEEHLIGYCRSNKIIVEATSPLGGEGRLIIDDPRLICMREFYKATASQVLLRWNIQRGIVAIPKSVRPERLLENSQLYDFELSNTDIDTISDMNRNERRNFDPDKVDSRPECMWPKIVNL